MSSRVNGFLEGLKASILRVWGYAALYSVVAAFLFAASPGKSRMGLELGQVVAAYWGAATTIGLLVGLLKPVATTPGRKFAVNVVAIWPAVFGMYALVSEKPFAQLDGVDLVFVTVFAVAYGAVGSVKWD